MSLTIHAKGETLNSDAVCSECGGMLTRLSVHLLLQAFGYIRDPNSPMSAASYRAVHTRRIHPFKCAQEFFAKAEAFGAPRGSYGKAFAKRKPKAFTMAVSGLLSQSPPFGS